MGKGSRRERELADLFQRAGFATYRPATVQYGENDVWGLFDVLAIAPHGRLWAVQVKSNRASGLEAWRRHTALFREHGIATGYAVPHDGEGWVLYDAGQRPDDGRRAAKVVVDERDADVKMGEGIVGHLSDIPRESRADKFRWNGGRG